MNDFGQVLETLRRARGMTQEDLRMEVGLTQASLSRYETGQRTPDDETIKRLAHALGVTPRFLTRDHTVRGALAVDAHMRRQRTAKASLWRLLEARLNKYRLHMSALFEEVSLRSETTVPTFDPIDTSPAEAALMVRAQWRMPIGPVRNLVRWLESAGCIVLEEDFSTGRIDGMCQWVYDHPVLLLNSTAPTCRKRFSLAHELGHLVLHNGIATEDQEREADEFASEFLMPSHVIRPDLRPATLGRLKDLKQVWGVSMQALARKALDLGMMSTAEHAAFYKALNARGWKTNEPGSDLLAPEHPQLIAAIGQTMRSKGLSDHDIADLAGFEDGDADNPLLTPGRRLHAV